MNRPDRSIAAVLTLAAALLAGCSHTISRAPNHPGGPFDFRKAECKNPPDGNVTDDRVSVRYLGAGGVAIRWQGETVLTAPFFSNYSLARVLCGRLRPNEKAIGKGLADVPLGTVRAILAGHSHYDHLGDLPVVVGLIPNKDVRVFTNDSGKKLLGHTLPDRVESLQGSLGKPVDIPGADGRTRFRVSAVRTEHAPHIFRYLWGKGEAEEWTGPWRPPVRRLKCGTPLAFVLDLLDPESGKTRFRIYLQDSASGAGQGLPPAAVTGDGHPFDLAVFCLPSYTLVRDAPGWLLGRLQPRHVLVIHYEDFFQSRNRRFVTLMTRRKADRYLQKIEDGLRLSSVEPRGPLGDVCGASTREWTLPLPGEALTFEAAR
ncbi:MAG TPA: hypothetical protein VLQ45_33735 [Thermoanaerobaculia bacterium]|nr:hypothetical protein [Thermoanaerobaculia bacterium]